MESVKKTLLGWVRMPMFYFCGILVVMDALFTKQILNTNGVDLVVSVVLVELVVEGGLIGLLAWAQKKGWLMERKFLILAIGLGGMFLILLPPGLSPDDTNHFRRAYSITQGYFVAEVVEDRMGGNVMPENISSVFVEHPSAGFYDATWEKMGEGFSETEVFQAYTNTALYSFVGYIPQTIAVMVGRLLNFSVLGTAYLVRAVNFVVWLILIYFAIKLTPKFKAVIMFIALLPITLQEVTSMAPDALTIGLGIFLIADVLYLMYTQKKEMKRRQLAVLYGLALVMGFCKIVYLPLVLLFVLIPAERFGGKKRKWIHLGTMAVAAGVVNLMWLRISSRFLFEIKPGVDSSAQLAGILQNPIGYVMTMFRTVNVQTQLWLSGALGMNLGSFEFNLPNLFFWISLVMGVLLLAQRDEMVRLKTMERMLVAAVFGATVVLMMTSLYMQWTAYGEKEIDGVQGRYFLPILLLVSLMIARTSDKQPHMALISEKMVMYYSVFVNAIALVTIFARCV